VYDLKGNKIARGRVLSATDTSLQLKGLTMSIPVRNIGSIRTKHSAGNNVLIGSIVGTCTIGIPFAIAGVDYASGEDDAAAAVVGVITGSVAGAVIGAATIPLKKSKLYLIDGNPEKWKTFRSAIPAQEPGEAPLGPQ